MAASCNSRQVMQHRERGERPKVVLREILCVGGSVVEDGGGAGV